MESLISSVAGILTIMILVVPLAFVWKYRQFIKRWLNDVDYGDLRTWEQKRATRAERDLIKANWKSQDAQDYLTYIKTKEEKTETE